MRALYVSQRCRGALSRQALGSQPYQQRDFTISKPCEESVLTQACSPAVGSGNAHEELAKRPSQHEGSTKAWESLFDFVYPQRSQGSARPRLRYSRAPIDIKGGNANHDHEAQGGMDGSKQQSKEVILQDGTLQKRRGSGKSTIPSTESTHTIGLSSRPSPAAGPQQIRARTLPPKRGHPNSGTGLPHLEERIKDPGPLLRALQNATKQTDTHRALKLWARFSKVQMSKMDVEHRDTTLTEFLWAFVKLGLIDHVLEVWNLLPKLGIKPTPTHWIAMIEACKRHRDLVSLKSIWKQMIASGELPRNPAWTAYLHALLFCKDVKGALAALNEMGQAWDSQKLARDKSNLEDVPETLRPSIRPVNAVLSGIIDMYRSETVRSPYIESVLAWIGKRQIAPDTDTYNILLRPAARKSNQEQVQQILADMKKNGCMPDVATFTILIDGIFRNPNSTFQTHNDVEQQSVVEKVFDDMESGGISPTLRTYSTVLDSLLSGPHPNLPAAQAVLKRMDRQNIVPSAHIYTILIHHYFASDPPNLDAIDAVWRRIESERTSADHVLYDRIIEGYAKLGETEKMLSFLRMMPKRGWKPGWRALTMALRALGSKGEWDMIEQIVYNVEHKDDYAKFGAWGWKWKEEWNELVAGLRQHALISRKDGGGS